MYTSIGIHANHMDMVRFTDEHDPGFIAVVSELHRWSKEIKQMSLASKAANTIPKSSVGEKKSTTENPSCE